jgi:hypothetical protein
MEILWRFLTAVRSRIWKRRRDWSSVTPLRSPTDHYVVPADHSPDAMHQLLRAANSLLNGQLVALGQVFALDDVDWHLDPQSGVSAPLRFAPGIDCRDPRVVGNVRNTWELNRHQHLSIAAAAYALTSDERYAEFVRRQLHSWLEQNPFPLGVNWASPLELGLRLLSWSWVFRLLSGSPVRDELFGERGRLWPSIHRHQWLIARTRSRGSSANNHLIGEMTGLFVASSVWDVFRESAGWSRQARTILHREVVSQYYPSGLNREQAYGYHVFATHLLALAALEAERRGAPFAPHFLQRLRQATLATRDLTCCPALPPTYGDSDDSIAVGLGVPPADASALLGSLVSDWLGDIPLGTEPEPAVRLAAAIQLSGVAARESIETPGTQARGSRSYRDAGVFELATGTPQGHVSVLADAGALGYLSIAAHGHADALSFTLAVDAERLIVDTGTCSYHYDPQARAYFRSTRAHNTVTVDAVSQSVAAGPFMWTDQARTSVREWRITDTGAVLVASHDGYERLADPVTHERSLLLDAGRLVVEDLLRGSAPHDIEWRLHFAPHCTARLQGCTCDVATESHALEILLDGSLQWSLLRGQPLAGRYSPSFNRQEPTTTLVGTARAVLPCRLFNEIRLRRP